MPVCRYLPSLTGSALIGSAIAIGASATPAAAQRAPYACVNESRRIDIAAQPMGAALDALSKQTNCPISHTAPIAGVTSQRVRGTFTPEQALKALVRGTGLTGRAIRQGLTVGATPRAAAARATSERLAPYDCQNVSMRLRVPAMRLDRALAMLSQQTRCPISRTFEVAGLISRRVEGRYTPPAALDAMLVGTGLRSRTIRQGLEILPAQ